MPFKTTHFILLISALLGACSSFGQQTCDSNDLQDDKVLLQNFWTTFKDAVNNKNKAKLEGLCHFPFTCDYCNTDTGSTSKPYVKVTKRAFNRTEYWIFFTDKLITEVNKHNLPQDLYIFQPYYNTVDKKCTYSFSYVARNENSQHPGKQHFFDIQKVNGQFMIIGTWTIP